MRDLGDEHRWIMDLRRQINDGTLEGPRVFASGPLFTAAGGHPIATFGVDPASDVVRVRVTPDQAHVHRELELLVGSGLAPKQALQAATVDAARVLGTDRLGAVAVGMAADLLAVRGDPSTDIAAIREVGLVFRDGRLFVDRRTKD